MITRQTINKAGNEKHRGMVKHFLQSNMHLVSIKYIIIS